MAINEEIQAAIGEIRATFPDSSVTVMESGDGGTLITVDPVPTGPSFTPAATWLTFHIPYNYPDADIYPHYVTAQLARKDGQPLGEAIHAGQSCGPRGETPATMISRRTNTLERETNSAAGKALNILRWLEGR